MLADLFLVSGLEVAGEGQGAPEGALGVAGLPGLQVTVAPIGGEKCPRCWHYSSALSEDPDLPGICPRCRNHVRAILAENDSSDRG